MHLEQHLAGETKNQHKRLCTPHITPQLALSTVNVAEHGIQEEIAGHYCLGVQHMHARGQEGQGEKRCVGGV